MSLTTNEFFAQLQDGDEWMNCFMHKSQMQYIPESVQMCMCINEVRQQNAKFEGDEVHKELIKDISKAKRALRNYEYNVNHKITKT